MPHDKHHILWPEGEHPSLELLRQYQQGNLPSALHHRLERHLLGCELCADVLEGMASSDTPQTKAAVADINRNIGAMVQQGKKKTAPVYWQTAAAILVLVASAVLVLYYNYKEQQPAQEITIEQEAVQTTAPPIAASPPAAPAQPDSQSVVSAPSPASIAAVTPERKYTSPVVKQDAEETAEDYVIVCDFLPEWLESDETPFDLAGIDDVTESKPLKLDSSDVSMLKEQTATMALAPEPGDVSKALAGKVAGVTIRGSSSLRKAAAPAANQKQIAGTVLSPEGEPLPGVVVMLKNRSTATTTDAEGKYSLTVPSGEQTLRFSYIGYETAEKALAKNDTSANVSLSPDKLALSEVVVTGYGEAKAAPAATPARPTIGMRRYKKYLKENSRQVPEQGKAVVAFTVGADGKPQQLRVVKSLCPACDKEALRLVKEGPRWKPATRNGQTIADEVKVKVQFK